jgi:hypothetical protein
MYDPDDTPRPMKSARTTARTADITTYFAASLRLTGYFCEACGEPVVVEGPG